MHSSRLEPAPEPLLAKSSRLRPRNALNGSNESPAYDSAAPILVSAIVIARDEAKTIGASVQGVLDALASIPGEIVVVDSGSTDDTALEAARFPVKLVSIAPDAPLSPSIAKHVGLQYARGEYILYVDGDTVLVEGWLDDALTTMRQDESLAAVAGTCEGIQENKGEIVVTDQYPTADYRSPLHLSGSALYRNSALSLVGGFNPNMRAAEEIELGARLRKAGYTLTRLRQPMSRHHRKAAPETVAELFRRVRRGYPVGEGQLWRHTVRFDLPQPDAFAQVRNAVTFITLIAAGVTTVLLAMGGGSPVPLFAWLALMACIFGAFAARTRSITRPSYYFLAWLLTGPLVAWGMLKRPYPPDVYPRLNVTVKDFRFGKADLGEDVTITSDSRSGDDGAANV